MEVVLLDKFMVSEKSKAAFLAEVRKSSGFLRTLPGFVEGFVYESTDSGSRHNVVTTAVWKNDEAFQNAKKRAAEEFQRIGFDPPEIMRNLKVGIERGIYRAASVLSITPRSAPLRMPTAEASESLMLRVPGLGRRSEIPVRKL